MSKLDPARVEEILKDCFLTEAEADTISEAVQAKIEDAPDWVVVVQGVVMTVGLHRERLAGYRDEIRGMLEELPDEFRKSVAGGWSFLNLCMTKDGHQWTSFHRTQEELCMLAIGVGLGEWNVPREAWRILPGGMPYFTYLDQEVAVDGADT